MKLKNAKVLLVDDEEDILEFLEYILNKEGATTKTAKNGVEGIKKAHKHKPDLILLDRMMPEMDGLEMCRELRKDPQFDDTKILFLSAKGEMESQIEGLELGADDYILKPIKSNLLISKIKSHLRKSKLEEKPTLLNYKHITIDTDKYLVYLDDQELILPKKEFELLYLLMSNPGHVFRREEILEKVWGKDLYIGDRTIDVHIRKLREKIGNDYFKTIKGVGYKFEKF